MLSLSVTFRVRSPHQQEVLNIPTHEWVCVSFHTRFLSTLTLREYLTSARRPGTPS